MSALSSPQRFLPPISPYLRAPSPTMSPIGRRGRPTTSSEDSHLRDLSPSDTLRAFTEQPMPFDTNLDEYKFFRCIEGLTAAEKDLGARVAKAAQRLQSWCQEVEQWGWTGSFEPPGEEELENRRRDIEHRVWEHIQSSAVVDSIGRLHYLGSLLAVEVEAHETRLDEISEELQTLEYDDLKEYLRDIYGPNRSRPPSAGYGASQPSYIPLDDFSMLITQTLMSSLPHHVQLQERLNTWTARLTVLREVPRYVDDLQAAQKAMSLGWDAIEPPKDTSDEAFVKWKEAVDTISGVLQDKISDLGRRLDRMLDTLEGREDCLPDKWIDEFENVEGNFNTWVAESRKRLVEFDLLRKTEQGVEALALKGGASSDEQSPHSTLVAPETSLHSESKGNYSMENTPQAISTDHRPRAVTAFKVGNLEASRNANLPPSVDEEEEKPPQADAVFTDSEYEEGDTVVHHEIEDPEDSFYAGSEFADVHKHDSQSPLIVTVQDGDDMRHLIHRPATPRSRRGSNVSIGSTFSLSSSPRSLLEDSPSARGTFNRRAKAPRPDLNAAIGKRRALKVIEDSALDEIPPWPPTQFSRQISPNTSTEDLDRKISEILTTIPGNIRLTSQSARDEATSTRGKLTSKPSRGYLRPTRSMNTLKNPPITLSSAKSSHLEAGVNGATGRRSAATMRPDNDIKLYHLTHPGKDKPMKLFIRRVGENGERVMVRVGGGWADLGEYLRQYIEHHGRRTISEGKFEIRGLEKKKILEGEKPDTSLERPQSAMSSVKRDRRFSGDSTPTTTPKRVPLAPRPATSLSSTPGSAVLPEDETTATPSTDASLRSWRGDEVGLAGPKAKKLDLSGKKLEWLEGMMKQARSVSSGNLQPPGGSGKGDGMGRDGASSRSESRNGNGRPKTAGAGAAPPTPAFADLGKVGRTKRVFLRSGAPL